ncbi:hypothetical protein VPHD479_0011 [Vibrio phage D479]
MKKEELEDHVSDLSKKDLYDFALEHFGIKLDTRRRPEVVLETFYKRVAKRDPIKPFARPKNVVRDPFAHIDADEVEEPVIEDLNDAETETVEITEVQVQDLSNGTDELRRDLQPDELERVEETPVFINPTYQLNMSDGTLRFAQVAYHVTDVLEDLKAGGKLKDLSLAADVLGHVLTTIQYARQLGSVTVRETRNSGFLKYKASDFARV